VGKGELSTYPIKDGINRKRIQGSFDWGGTEGGEESQYDQAEPKKREGQGGGEAWQFVPLGVPKRVGTTKENRGKQDGRGGGRVWGSELRFFGAKAPKVPERGGESNVLVCWVGKVRGGGM